MKYRLTEEEKLLGRLAFERVYKAYYRNMYNIAVSILRDRMLAEDAVQDSYIKILEYIRKRKVDLESPAFYKIITTITRNCSIDLLRMKIRRMEIPVDDIYDRRILSEHKISTEQRLQLFEKIDCLPPKYRDVFLLKFIRGYRNKEVANILKITQVNVRKRLQRGKKMLLEQMEAEKNNEG